NFTGLGISTGGNTFLGYTTAWVSAGASTPSPADPTVVPQAIRDLDSNGKNARPRPQLAPWDVTAQANSFGNAAGPVSTFKDIENLVYHDLDNSGLGFVTYGTASATAPNVVPGTLIYYSATPADGGTFTATGIQRSMIRAIQATFDSFVYLDPNQNSGLTL